MSEKPIIFNADMVRAILDGRKTQTRRIVKNYQGDATRENPLRMDLIKCPFGAVGDELWVRESIGRRTASFLGIKDTNGCENAYYVADGEDVVDVDGFNLCPWWKAKTLPSIHMPRGVSRIQLKITDIRVERLQDVSEDDAMSEGVTTSPAHAKDIHRMGQIAFKKLWQSINGAASWHDNPWVWVVEFERIKP